MKHTCSKWQPPNRHITELYVTALHAHNLLACSLAKFLGAGRDIKDVVGHLMMGCRCYGNGEFRQCKVGILRGEGFYEGLHKANSRRL